MDREVFTRAERAVDALGVQCLPLLRHRLQARDSWIFTRLLDFQELLPFQPVASADSRQDANLQACRILGPAAAPLIPEILPFLAGYRQVEAVKVLAAIGSHAVDPLVHVLYDADPQMWAGAIAVLGTIVPKKDSVVPAVEKHLGDPDSETRMAAAWALGRFAARARTSVPKLEPMTRDSEYNVREQSKKALARITRLPVAGSTEPGWPDRFAAVAHPAAVFP